jgi:uncharacterized OB-fold protein
MTSMQRMAESAARGRLALQRCIACGVTQYPPRELCAACLADKLEWCIAKSAAGEVLASTDLYHSHEATFQAHLPLGVGLVRLDAGPTIVCFLTEGCPAGMRVQVTARGDAAGRAVFTATVR